MSHIETQLGHSNIADPMLKRIRKYCSKKTTDITEEKKKEHILKVKRVFLLLKNLHVI